MSLPWGQCGRVRSGVPASVTPRPGGTRPSGAAAFPEPLLSPFAPPIPPEALPSAGSRWRLSLEDPALINSAPLIGLSILSVPPALGLLQQQIPGGIRHFLGSCGAPTAGNTRRGPPNPPGGAPGAGGCPWEGGGWPCPVPGERSRCRELVRRVRARVVYPGPWPGGSPRVPRSPRAAPAPELGHLCPVIRAGLRGQRLGPPRVCFDLEHPRGGQLGGK